MPALLKLRNRRQTKLALSVAVQILGSGLPDPAEIAGIVESWPDSPHLLRVCAGRVSDEDLWEDVRDIARMHSTGGNIASELAHQRMAASLAACHALLALPEANRVSVLPDSRA